jgi:transcriptional regulator with GAF, ATPase, and Fis domain
LIAGDRFVGVMNVESPRLQAFTTEDEQLLTALASQLAVIIVNARLHEETQQRLAEVSTLYSFAEKLSSSLDLPELLDLIVTTLRRVLNCRGVSISLLMPETQTLEIRAAAGLQDKWRQSAKLKVGEGISGQVAATATTVLITGETGTGKEKVAQTLHHLSPRREKPFIKVNCGALPANLIESELFGHVRGAFTGAQSARKGRFELADGGTLFLDEIGELPLELQPKLLRALQEREIEPLPGARSRRGPLPPGPLLPAVGVPDPAAAPAGAPRGHRGPGRIVPGAVRPGEPAHAAQAGPGGPEAAPRLSLAGQRAGTLQCPGTGGDSHDRP